MNQKINFLSSQLMLGCGLVCGLSLLQANEIKQVKVSEHTFSAFEDWQSSFGENEPKGAVPILCEKVRFVTPVIPGMSPHTQLLDPAVRNLLVVQITDKAYGLTGKDQAYDNEEQMKKRWVMAEDRLISVPNNFEPHLKLGRFFRDIVQLGLEEFEYVKQMTGKQGQLNKQSEAFRFFFMSDALRLEYLRKLTQGAGGGLSDKLLDEINKNDELKRIKSKLSTEEERQKFADWMVDKVYSPVVDRENGKQKIKLVLEALQDKTVTNYTISKINSKFDRLNITVKEVVIILTFLIDES